MTKKQMILRIAQKRAGISKIDWNNKVFTETQKQLMKSKYDELWDYLNLDIYHLENTTIEVIKQFILEKKKEGYELFYIDNLGFISGSGTEFEVSTTAIRELKQLTNVENITINLVHHFNKGNSQERKGPRGMASIRGSGKIENDTDYVLQVWRDLEEDTPVEEKKFVSLYLQKDREWGDPSYVEIEFDRGDYKEKEKNF